MQIGQQCWYYLLLYNILKTKIIERNIHYYWSLPNGNFMLLILVITEMPLPATNFSGAESLK